eukprot:scaffold7642_cov96-Skeletonema_marinoi.AAC.1
MGHAYIGSDCPERHFRSNYPEVTTRRNDPILSWSHLRASLIHELAEDPSIRIYYPSCDSIPSNLPHVSVSGPCRKHLLLICFILDPILYLPQASIYVTLQKSYLRIPSQE